MSSLFKHNFRTGTLQQKPVNDDSEIFRMLDAASALSTKAQTQDHQHFNKAVESTTATQGSNLRAVSDTATPSFFTQKQAATQTAKPNLQVVGGSSFFAQQRAVVNGAPVQSESHGASEEKSIEHVSSPRM